jgi:hypothetical protein
MIRPDGMPLTVALTVAGALLAIAGFRAVHNPAGSGPQQPAPIVHQLPGIKVHEFTASDGTRCLASSAGGIVCEWLWMEAGEDPGYEDDEPAGPPRPAPR